MYGICLLNYLIFNYGFVKKKFGSPCLFYTLIIRFMHVISLNTFIRDRRPQYLFTEECVF